MKENTKSVTVRKWPLRGYLFLVAVLLLLGMLLRNQGNVSAVLVFIKNALTPVVRVFSLDDSFSIHVETGDSSPVESNETNEGADEDVAQKLSEIVDALTPKHPPQAEVEEVDSDVVTTDDMSEKQPPQPIAPLTEKPQPQTPQISCGLSSDFSRAVLGGDFKTLRNLMAEGCAGASPQQQAIAVDELVQNGAGTYFKLIKLHQQKRLMIHELANRNESFAGAFIQIRDETDAKRIDPVGLALEKLDFPEAKKQLIQLLDRTHSHAKELAPLLTKIDAYATFYSFVARKCRPKTLAQGE